MSSEDRPNWTKIAIAAAGVLVAGAAIYYLSSEDSIDFDFKGKHKIENLRILLNELHLEYTCIYSRYYNATLKLKEQKKFDDKIKFQVENDLKADLAEKNKQVIAVRETARDDFKEGLDPEGLTKWIEHFKDDPEVKRLAGNIKKLHEDVFVRGKVDQMSFDLPEKLDKQMYIKMYRKIWATIRHDLWARIQQEKKTLNTSNLPVDVFNKLYTEVHGTFETVRMEIYNKLMGEDVERHQARENMQKAYITYATVSGVTGDGGTAIRSRWADLVNEAAMQHGEYIEQFSKGQFYNNISEDPRDTVESDEKISLANFAGYKSQKTLAPKGVKQNEVEMSEQTETELKKIANHIMNRVGRIRQRKLELQMIIAHESARKLSNEESFVTNEGVQVSPTKQEQAASPVKHEEAAEPMKHEEAAEPMKHEEAAEPLKVEEVLEPAKHEEAAVPDEPVAKQVDQVKEVVEQVHEEAKVSESFDEIKHEEVPVETQPSVEPSTDAVEEVKQETHAETHAVVEQVEQPVAEVAQTIEETKAEQPSDEAKTEPVRVVTQTEVKDDKTQDSMATTVAGAAYNKSNTKKGKKNKSKN